MIKREKVQGAYADYWISYFLTFVTKENFIVAPITGHDRYPKYTEWLSRQRRVAYLDDNIQRIQAFKTNLEAKNITWKEVQADSITLLIFDKKRSDTSLKS